MKRPTYTEERTEDGVIRHAKPDDPRRLCWRASRRWLKAHHREHGLTVVCWRRHGDPSGIYRYMFAGFRDWNLFCHGRGDPHAMQRWLERTWDWLPADHRTAVTGMESREDARTAFTRVQIGFPMTGWMGKGRVTLDNMQYVGVGLFYDVRWW